MHDMIANGIIGNIERVGLEFSCISKKERVTMDIHTLVHLSLDSHYYSLNKLSHIYSLK